MIELKNLVSILECHKLTDEQSEELQKVIYMLDDGRLGTPHTPFTKADRIHIAFLCDEKKCAKCREGSSECRHTLDISHAKNYKDINDVDLKNDFDLIVITPNDLVFTEKER